MIQSILGWAILAALLAASCLIPVELLLALVRRLRPGLRPGLRSRVALVGAGAVGLWYIIPHAVHAMLGRAAH